MRPASALVVPVPSAEPVVRAWRLRRTAAAGGPAPRPIPPHVTVLYPFLPARRIDSDVENAVAEIAAGLSPFPFTLGALRRFPGVLYLAPAPAEPFIAATEALCTRWPACQPYGGRFPQVVPHVTVAEGAESAGETGILAPYLPVQAAAVELALLVEGPRGMVVRRRFPLGMSLPGGGGPLA